MLRDLLPLTGILGDLGTDDPATKVIGAGVFGMLVALFTLFMRATMATGKRADERSDAELARARADLAAVIADRDHWQQMYIDLLEKRGRD